MVVERGVRRWRDWGNLDLTFVRKPRPADGVKHRFEEDGLFVDAKPHELFIGSQRLDDYLRGSDLGWVLRLRVLLAALDRSSLASRDQVQGLHARCWDLSSMEFLSGSGGSLREQEDLARRDVEAW